MTINILEIFGERTILLSKNIWKEQTFSIYVHNFLFPVLSEKTEIKVNIIGNDYKIKKDIEIQLGISNVLDHTRCLNILLYTVKHWSSFYQMLPQWRRINQDKLTFRSTNLSLVQTLMLFLILNFFKKCLCQYL